MGILFYLCTWDWIIVTVKVSTHPRNVKNSFIEKKPTKIVTDEQSEMVNEIILTIKQVDKNTYLLQQPPK